MTFGQRLHKLRTSRDTTQSELAKYLKISKSLISMYERDQRKPSFEILEGIADFFNIDMNTLYGIKGDDNNYLSSLTPHESELIQKYRLLPESGKATVDAVIEVQYQSTIQVKVKNDEVI